LDAAAIDELDSREAGSTGIIVVITAQDIFTAGVGDCRVILEQDISMLKDAAENIDTDAGVADTENEKQHPEEDVSVSKGVLALSTDHTLRNTAEMARLRALGAEFDADESRVVYYCPETSSFGGRKQEMVMPTRTFGNAYSKLRVVKNEDNAVEEQKKEIDSQENIVLEKIDPSEHTLTAEPQIMHHCRTDVDRFLVMACDGIWDVMSNQDVCQSLRDRYDPLQAAHNPDTPRAPDRLDTTQLLNTSRQLLTECLERGSTDNMTVLVIGLTTPTAELKKSLFDDWARDDDGVHVSCQ
jgi:serine/threonine protein phosphatase PrpC